MQISKGTVVKFHYRINDLDGKELESNFSEQAIAYLHGYNNMMPGIEKSLESMSKGDLLEAELEAKETYGEIQADSEQRVSVKHLHSTDKTADKKIDETVYGKKKKDSSLKKEKSEVVLPNILFFNKSLIITSTSDEVTNNIKLLFNNDYKDISAFYVQNDDVDSGGNMYTVVSPNEILNLF